MAKVVETNAVHANDRARPEPCSAPVTVIGVESVGAPEQQAVSTQLGMVPEMRPHLVDQGCRDLHCTSCRIRLGEADIGCRPRTGHATADSDRASLQVDVAAAKLPDLARAQRTPRAQQHPK